MIRVGFRVRIGIWKGLGRDQEGINTLTLTANLKLDLRLAVKIRVRV